MFYYVLYVCGGEGWLGFPDLWSGQKPWWNWYLTPVVNFGEVRRAQLTKSILLTSSLVPWDIFRSFKVCSDAEATGSHRTYSSLVKLRPRFLSLQWKTCLWAELKPCAWVCSERPALGQNTMMMMMMSIIIWSFSEQAIKEYVLGWNSIFSYTFAALILSCRFITSVPLGTMCMYVYLRFSGTSTSQVIGARNEWLLWMIMMVKWYSGTLGA